MARMDKIGASDLQDFIRHWLETPVNGYLGSGYGSDPQSLLHTPLKAGLADGFLNKMRADLPLIAALPRGALNLYAVDEGPDKLKIFIDASGQLVALGTK